MATDATLIATYDTLRLWVRYMVEEAERLKDEDLQAYLEVVQIAIEQRRAASGQTDDSRPVMRH
jgi:hypothetical protein